MNRILARLRSLTGGRSYAFVFLCHKGEMEIKALLLAASLGKFLKCNYKLVAALPAPGETWGGMPCEATLSLLARLGARTVPVVNEINPLYWHSHKTGCLKISTTAEKIVFIESDFLCLREFRDEPRFDAEINVKPADLPPFPDAEAVWKRAYEAAGVPMPAERIATTVSGEVGPPYFGVGFIALNNTGIPLSDTWVECAHTLDRAGVIPKKEPWSDQPSFVIAMHKLKLRYDMLGERYNFPAHLRKLDADALPWFAHYHQSHVIAREPLLADLVRELAAAHPEIRDLMLQHENWKAMV